MSENNYDSQVELQYVKDENIIVNEEQKINKVEKGNVIQAVSPAQIIKFDPNYILCKLYDYNVQLGGNLLDEEAQAKAQDPFFHLTEEIKSSLSNCKKLQDQRNKLRKKSGKTLESTRLTNEIQDLLDRSEDMVNELNNQLREQATEGDLSPEELEQKEESYEAFRKLLMNLREREDKSLEIIPIDQDNIDLELQAFVGFDNEGDEPHGQARELTNKERAALDKWKEEDEELDVIISDIDAGMDELLGGIDQIGENLKEQKGLIENVDHQVDDLTNELGNQSKKLKATIKNFRKASNIVVDIAMIVILAILIMALVIVIKKMYF